MERKSRNKGKERNRTETSVNQRVIFEKNAEGQVKYQVGVAILQTVHHKRKDQAKRRQMSGKDRDGTSGMPTKQRKEGIRSQKRKKEKTSDENKELNVDRKMELGKNQEAQKEKMTQ